MSSSADKMHLSMVLRPGGYHRAAWRHPVSEIHRATDFSAYREQAEAAEKASFDAIFLADAVALSGDPWDHVSQPLEPLTLLSAIAAATRHIGLIATASTTYSEPYNLARQLASLDHISGGRAGWNVVTTADERAAANFGAKPYPEHAERYRRAREFVDVARKLWASWEAGAVVLDKAVGIQTDAAKIRPIDFRGDYFEVEGPLNVPPSPQGHPVLFHAGQSPDGLVNAVRYGEGLFSVHHDREMASAFLRGLNGKLVEAGRAADSCLVLPGLVAIQGGTEAEARAREDELRELGGQADADRELSKFLGIDIGDLPGDRPIDIGTIRRPGDIKGPQSWYRTLHAMIADERLTPDGLRTRHRAIGRSGHLQIVGTPEQVAEMLIDWFRHRACHGFNLMGTTVPDSLVDFAEQVVPLLVRAGVFRSAYEQDTLRGHLGLDPVPGERPRQ